MDLLQRLQLAKPLVVLRVAHRGRVERVVLVVVTLDQLPELGRARARLPRNAHEEKSRSARWLPGKIPRAFIFWWIVCNCARIAPIERSESGTRLSSTSVPPSPSASVLPVSS